MESQITEEVRRMAGFIDQIYGAFGLTYTAKFATRPPQRIGSDEMWDKAEASLKTALEALGLQYELKPGDGAFYGPKIDFDVSDSIGRKWQLGTIQLDYAAPERFDLEYVGEDNAMHRPVIIHRAIYGSFERFFAILIEHFAGAFPTWLAPVQARVVTVADRHAEWGRQVQAALQARCLRVEIDDSSDKLGAKIRNAQLEKIPYTLVVGDNEVAAKGVAPRTRGEGKQADLGFMELQAFADLLGKEAAVPY
jgi:threonyl-tRNA synthetase